VTYPSPTPTPPPPPLAAPVRQAPTGTTLTGDANIQGNILAGFNKDFAAFLFVQLPNQTSGQAYLSDLRPLVSSNADVASFNVAFSAAHRTSGSDPDNLNATWIGVSITAAGLALLSPTAFQTLQTPPVTWDATIASFLAGAAADTEAVAQSGPEAPANWLFGSPGQAIHLIVVVESDSADGLAGAVQEVYELSARHGVSVVFQQNGRTLPGPRHGHEHFGFKDGISQPAIQGFLAADPDGQPLIAAGEFILGYPGQNNPGRVVPLWMFDGSFLVLERVAQDVPGWWAQAEQLAGELGLTPETAGAALVGRWRDGTPVALDPGADPRSGPNESTANSFTYSDDPAGVNTQLFAHIRKVNPRSGTVPGQDVVSGHRIIRRGIPFGDPFDPALGKDHGPDAERGLMFACYQASIVEQFSFVQASWASQVNFPEPNEGPDPLIGPAGSCPFATSQGSSTSLTLNRFVKVEGAVYAFTPSIPALAALAAGSALPDLAGDTPLT
jgi:Dyp-type peroxidase family